MAARGCGRGCVASQRSPQQRHGGKHRGLSCCCFCCCFPHTCMADRTCQEPPSNSLCLPQPSATAPAAAETPLKALGGRNCKTTAAIWSSISWRLASGTWLAREPNDVKFPACVLLASASCSLSQKLKAAYPSFAIFAWYSAARLLFFRARQGLLFDSLLLRRLW